MHQDSLMIKTIDVMTQSMMNNMTKVFEDTMYTNMGLDMSKYTKKLMDRSLKQSKENAIKLLNYDLVDIYDRYFTAAEIDDFSTFYKSASGQKLLSQTPNITKDVMAIMTTKYQADFRESLMKDLQEMSKEIEAEVKAKKHQ